MGNVCVDIVVSCARLCMDRFVYIVSFIVGDRFRSAVNYLSDYVFIFRCAVFLWWS